MTVGNRIPTPLKHKWRRFRHNALPMLSFAVCVLLVLVLWRQQGSAPNAVAVAQTKQVDITSNTGGRIAKSPGDRYWSLFEPVKQGEVIVRLNATDILQQIATLRTRVATLKRQVEAKRVEMELEREASDAQFLSDHTRLQSDFARQLLNLKVEHEQRSLDVLDRKAKIQQDEVAYARLEARRKALEFGLKRKTVSEIEYRDAALAAKEIEILLAASKVALDKAETMCDDAEQRLRSTAATPVDVASRFANRPTLEEIAVLVAPIVAEGVTLEAELAELAVAVDGLQITAPITGTICEILRYPGEVVRPGEPILVIAAEESEYLLSYIHQKRFVPKLGMKASVRSRSLANLHEDVSVEFIGPQIVPVPPQLLADPTKPEWGLPVRLGMPQKLTVRPGELFDIRFVSYK